MFSSAAQDCSNKYATAELLYGVAQANSIPDLERTELLLVIGTNPRVSKSSFLSVPDPVRALARHPRSRSVASCSSNPCALEPDIGETLQLQARHRPVPARRDAPRDRPHRRLLASARSTATSRTSTTCGRSSRPTPPTVVAPIVGIPAEQIAELTARDSPSADGALGPRVDRAQHGSPGRARLLAGPDARAAHRQPRPSGRQLLRRPRPARSRPTPVDRTESSFVDTKWGRVPTHRRDDAGGAAGRSHRGRRGTAAGAVRRRRQSRALDRWRRAAAGRAAFARPARDHRSLPQRDRRARRLRAARHRPVRARGPQHLRAGGAEDAVRAVDGQGHASPTRNSARSGASWPSSSPPSDNRSRSTPRSPIRSRSSTTAASRASA